MVPVTHRFFGDAAMALNSLQDLFLHELKDVLHAEKQILKALPKMAKATTNEELKAAFEEHLEQTEKQVERLEQVFEIIGKPARAKKCVGMEGLIEEGQELISEEPPAEVLDAGLIACAQKVEHYEICAYGTLATYAKQLGFEDAAELLGETLNEEKETDEKLTQIAMQLNQEAETAGASEEEE
jgi:ferritin-like metal-binding protein YciE